MEKLEKQFTPEKKAELQKERTLNDGELLKGGAQYKFNETGKTFRLEPTAEQEEKMREEYELEVAVREYLRNADMMLKKLESVIEKRVKIEESIQRLENQTQKIQDLKRDLKQYLKQYLGNIDYFEDKEIVSKLETLNQKIKETQEEIEEIPLNKSVEEIQEEIKEIPFDLNRLKFAQKILTLLQARKNEIGNPLVLKDFLEAINPEVANLQQKVRELRVEVIKNNESGEEIITSRKFLAEIYEKLGQLDKAREQWLRTVEIDEDDEDLVSYSAVVEAYEKLGQPDKAREMWLKAIEHYKKEERYYAAAEAYEKLNQPDKAREMWLKAVESYKEIVVGMKEGDRYSFIAEAYKKLGQPDKAREMWLKAAEYYEKMWWGGNAAAEIYEKLSQSDKAREVLLNVVIPYEKNGTSDLSENVAEAYEKLGQFDKAIGVYLKLAEKEDFRQTGLKYYEKSLKIAKKQSRVVVTETINYLKEK